MDFLSLPLRKFHWLGVGVSTSRITSPNVFVLAIFSSSKLEAFLFCCALFNLSVWATLSTLLFRNLLLSSYLFFSFLFSLYYFIFQTLSSDCYNINCIDLLSFIVLFIRAAVKIKLNSLQLPIKRFSEWVNTVAIPSAKEIREATEFGISRRKFTIVYYQL